MLRKLEKKDTLELASVAEQKGDEEYAFPYFLAYVMNFEYDGAGNQTAIIDEKGNRTEFLYDAERVPGISASRQTVCFLLQ